MARILLCLAAACCLALLLPPPVQGRPAATGSDDHRPLFPEPHLDAAVPTEQQQGDVPVKKAAPSWSPRPRPPTTGGVVTPELRTVPEGANPLHNYVITTRQEEPTVPAAAAEGGVVVVRPVLRTTPWVANPLHKHGSTPFP